MSNPDEKPASQLLPDDASNRVFPDISEEARAAGQVELTQLHAVQRAADTDPAPTTWRTWRDRAAAWYTAAALWLSVALAPAIAWTKERWATQAKPFLREHLVAVVVFLTGMVALIATVFFIWWVVLPIKEASAANARADAAERVAADLRKQLSASTPIEGPTEALQQVAKPRPKPARPAAPDEYDGLYGGQSPSEIIDEALGHKPSPSGAWTTPTDLDRRLAEFQKRIDATPSPTL